MAERSFRKEVEHLRAGAGETFTGEGILALTKALLENGVGYVGGYQGAPISHLMDVLADAQDLLGELDVRFEANASEAAAAAMLAASVHYPIRGAVTFKGSVGVNVASDALANLSSSGVTGGAFAGRSVRGPEFATQQKDRSTSVQGHDTNRRRANTDASDAVAFEI